MRPHFWCLPVRLHLFLTFAIALALGLSAGYITMPLHPAVFLVSLPCAFMGTVWLFQHVIPAKCPRCAGPTYLQKFEMHDTYKYKCKSCGYVHDTEEMHDMDS